ncbi:alanyl-tRNA synthetase [Sulfurivirga caldicuralii]|uniref:Alanine--tRNA ligase n=2 Tax=Sulfurivirga caldicuralii TaxID=364032 RepID=A0A1N6GG16_9GAMM|nr:alanyl-tRNA synthetase [Sulfurivirga caldicuralii]
MNKMSTAQLRKAFIDYFVENGHKAVHSSPVVPANDPTLLFTNAGMVQFKDVFLGLEQRPYTRACSVQRCIRAGGKHNDLENVGYTARHHTFFEMLGNFSFGDYFKREAIRYAWEFLTQRLGIPEEKLWVTVFHEDDEAADIWLNEIGVSPQRFSRCGEKDNFWSMGDTGPCGPCSEIFYDHGPEVPGGPPGSPEEDGDRYIEIWNLVFMQFNRDADGTLTPLPKPSVDTGMGLERLAAVMQGVHSNYDIDLFQALIDAAQQVTGAQDRNSSSLKVIADHIRSTSFIITDGVLPSNEGRGYVLRRIIRRAIRHGYKLGQKQPFFHMLVQPLVEQMGDAYPELKAAAPQVEKVLRQEEERFAETLENGMKLLEAAMAELSGDTIAGDVVFKLYDTYGFPVDLTADVARERGLKIDEAGFEAEMRKQRERARKAGSFKVDMSKKIDFEGETEFVGYQQDAADATVLALYRDDERVPELKEGEEGMVILDRTPFYAESGGQVGDTGSLTEGMNSFHVADTQKQGKLWLHVGRVTAGSLREGQSVHAQVDVARRRAAERNHSATHLLHAALRNHLGEHVAQKGSLVTPERLRFDFSHFEPIAPETLRAIEREVNEKIMENVPVVTEEMSLDAAREKGAMALFGEKYGDVVRVVDMGDYSIELCGGTHVCRTGDIGPFRIVSEGGVAAGVRRVEAITGTGAWDWIYSREDALNRAAETLKAKRPEQLPERAEQIAQQLKQLEKQVEQLQAKMAAAQGSELVSQAQQVGDVQVLAARVDGADGKVLRELMDQLKQKLDNAVIVLGGAKDSKVALVAGVSKPLTKRFKAGELVNFVAQQVGGKGGGRPDMAQAGGSQPENLDAALASVARWVEERNG